MSQQTIKQRARRTAWEMAKKRRRERAERERRLIDLAERVMVAIGERDAAVAGTEATRLRRLAADDQDVSGSGAADDSVPATTATADSGGARAGTTFG